MHGSSACLGCCIRPTVNNSASKLSKELGVQGNLARKRSISDDFWTTSTCDMDNSAVQSQGSISSLGTNNQILDAQGGGGNSNAPSEFVNHGLLLWNQTRQSWVGKKRPENRTHQVREPKLNWSATYESLLGSNKPFPQPIPLSVKFPSISSCFQYNMDQLIIHGSQYWQEMVDFLVDIWEQEGLYD